MFTSVDSMGKVGLMLDLIAKKNKALGTNLANMDTPGYVRQDIDFATYLGSMNSPLETKLSEKLGPSPVLMDRDGEEIDPANELMQMQQNSLMYTMATRRMSNIITEMKTVINVGK
ncbi:hypothetical protein IJF81_02995 [bacterium]|nr:hypothetical protein [bacterium]